MAIMPYLAPNGMVETMPAWSGMPDDKTLPSIFSVEYM
jgi:hypothetical protein